MANDLKGSPQIANLQFNYIKSPQYREVACHGAIGGATPQGGIWMSLYAERTPIPRVVEWDVPKPEGGDTIRFDETAAGPPSRIETRHGVIRHIEVTVYMDLEMAKRLHLWLSTHIANLERGRASEQ
jgi:hypothetical protein